MEYHIVARSTRKKYVKVFTAYTHEEKISYVSDLLRGNMICMVTETSGTDVHFIADTVTVTEVR
jgi:hypothetical protein